MGCKMRRVASDEGAACIRKQGQPYQVLGSTDRHGTIDIVSYPSCLFFSRNLCLSDTSIKTLSRH